MFRFFRDLMRMLRHGTPDPCPHGSFEYDGPFWRQCKRCGERQTLTQTRYPEPGETGLDWR